ncbi:MAG: hypothetical protein AAGA90_02335 [Actinomycetota bacterium]
MLRDALEDLGDRIHASRAVVEVRASGCGAEPTVASGVVLRHNARTVVAVPAQVVAGATAVEGEGWPFPLPVDMEVVAFDPRLDVALLQATLTVPAGRERRDVAGDFTNGVDVSTGETPDRAEVLRWTPTGTAAVVVDIVGPFEETLGDIYGDQEVVRQVLQVNGDFVAGALPAGAPIIDEGGDLIGIIDDRSPADGSAWAAVATELMPALETVGYDVVDNGTCP